MIRRRVHEPVENFYISFSDMISLLLVFFIYLFSISDINPVKFLQATSSVKKEMKVQVQDELLKRLQLEQKKLQEMKQKIDAYIVQKSLQGVVGADYRQDHLEIRLGNVLLFEQGQALLRNQASEVLSQIGTIFAQGDSKIVVEGHTDDQPIHSPVYPSNWELSSARASSVVRELTLNGVPESQCVVVGYNQYMPLVTNTNEDNRAKNRRVRIILRPDIDKLMASMKTPSSSESAL